jgi:hypothetical protein
MEFTEDEIFIEKPPTALDRLILDVARVFEANDVRYVVVSGYVAVLLGRSRATEDIDVLTERFDRETAESVADDLRDAGFWGSAMPLDDLYDTLADGLPVRIAESGERVPNVEMKFVSDEYDRLSLSDTTTVSFGDEVLQIVAPELQIAYKLGMSADRDFEDALHLYRMTRESLTPDKLEGYVERLGVEDQYAELRDK